MIKNPWNSAPFALGEIKSTPVSRPLHVDGALRFAAAEGRGGGTRAAVQGRGPRPN